MMISWQARLPMQPSLEDEMTGPEGEMRVHKFCSAEAGDGVELAQGVE